MWACQRWCHVCCFNNFQKQFNPPSKNEKMCTKQQYYYFLSYFCGVSLENYIIVLMFCYIKLLRWLLSDESFHCPPRFCSDHLSRHWLIQLMYRLNEWRVFNAVPSELKDLVVCVQKITIFHMCSLIIPSDRTSRSVLQLMSLQISLYFLRKWKRGHFVSCFFIAVRRYMCFCLRVN